jgi:hypothetical protein
LQYNDFPTECSLPQKIAVREKTPKNAFWWNDELQLGKKPKKCILME